MSYALLGIVRVRVRVRVKVWLLLHFVEETGTNEEDEGKADELHSFFQWTRGAVEDLVNFPKASNEELVIRNENSPLFIPFFHAQQ